MCEYFRDINYEKQTRRSYVETLKIQHMVFVNGTVKQCANRKKTSNLIVYQIFMEPFQKLTLQIMLNGLGRICCVTYDRKYGAPTGSDMEGVVKEDGQAR